VRLEGGAPEVAARAEGAIVAIALAGRGEQRFEHRHRPAVGHGRVMNAQRVLLVVGGGHGLALGAEDALQLGRGVAARRGCVGVLGRAGFFAGFQRHLAAEQVQFGEGIEFGHLSILELLFW